MAVGIVEYGTWKDGSSVYKDSKGYYIVAIRPNGEGPEYKKYLKGWKPVGDTMCLVKRRWTMCKKEKARKTRKSRS